MKLGYSQKILFLLTMTVLLASSTSMGVQAADTIGDGVSPDAIKLTIASRHDSTIYEKYKTYFAASDLAESVGITSPDQIKVYNPTTYSGFKTHITDDFLGASVAWGGGPTLFNRLIQEDLLKTIDDPSLLDWISANVSDTIAGADMKKKVGDDLKWVAAAISSFGFTVNNKTLGERNLPFPTSWDDLASPEFFTSLAQTNIAMGNAPDTTSNTRIYQIILQNYGWERGWEIIYSMAGNSDIYGGSVETRSAVEDGAVAVAMTIDFYGVIAMNTNPDTQYVIPEGASIVNGDPIAISAKAADFGELEAARAFVKYVLSAEGQALWQDDRINRLPVREDAFTYARNLVGTDPYISDENIDSIQSLYTQTLDNQGISFDEDLAISLEEAMRYHFESTITDVHSNLRSAWSDIARNYNQGAFPEQRLEQLRSIFGDPAITLEEAQSLNSQIISDPSFRQSTQGSWENFAINKYAATSDAVDDDYTIYEVITTTDSNGNTITRTLSELGTADTVGDNVQDLSLYFLPVIIAMISPIIISKIARRNNKH